MESSGRVRQKTLQRGVAGPTRARKVVEVPMGGALISTDKHEVLRTRALSGCSALAICTSWSEAEGYFTERLLYHIPSSDLGSTFGAPCDHAERYGLPANLVNRLIARMASGECGGLHVIDITFGTDTRPFSHSTLLRHEDLEGTPYPLLRLVELAGGAPQPNASATSNVRLHVSNEVTLFGDAATQLGRYHRNRDFSADEIVAVVREAVGHALAGAKPESKARLLAMNLNL